MSEENQSTISRRSLFKVAGLVAGSIGAVTLLPGCAETVPTGSPGTSASGALQGPAPAAPTSPERTEETRTAQRKINWRNDPEICVGCGDCNYICPACVLELKEGKSSQANPENCLGCRMCYQECWQGAIDMDVFW